MVSLMEHGRSFADLNSGDELWISNYKVQAFSSTVAPVNPAQSDEVVIKASKDCQCRLHNVTT